MIVWLAADLCYVRHNCRLTCRLTLMLASQQKSLLPSFQVAPRLAYSSRQVIGYSKRIPVVTSCTNIWYKRR